LISVITRTKDRTFFLPRVFESLKQQSYRPIEWIIVNDAGESIDEFISECKENIHDGFNIKYVYKKESTTMEAATNVGLSEASGDYINILDDDDTIAKDFYRDAIESLKCEEVDSVKGIVAYSQYIYEEVLADHRIKFLRETPTPFRPTVLTLASILQENQFPIHSFIYKREALLSVGNYDEAYPVLGDWEFNIRFLENFDIVIIPKVYVNYHKRESLNYANTVVVMKDQHLKYESIIRNRILRSRDETSNLSLLMGQGNNSKILINELNQIQASTNYIKGQLHAQILQRDEVIENKNEAILLRDEVIESKNEAISLRDIVIEKKNFIVAEKEGLISRRDKAIESKNRLLEESQKAIAMREEVIKEKNRLLEESQKAIYARRSD